MYGLVCELPWVADKAEQLISIYTKMIMRKKVIMRPTCRKSGLAPATAILVNVLRGSQMAQTALEHTIPLQHCSPWTSLRAAMGADKAEQLVITCC